VPMKSSASIWVPQTPASPSWRARWVVVAESRSLAHAALFWRAVCNGDSFQGPANRLTHAGGCGAAVLHQAAALATGRVPHDTHKQDLQNTKRYLAAGGYTHGAECSATADMRTCLRSRRRRA